MHWAALYKLCHNCVTTVSLTFKFWIFYNVGISSLPAIFCENNPFIGWKIGVKTRGTWGSKLGVSLMGPIHRWARDCRAINDSAVRLRFQTFSDICVHFKMDKIVWLCIVVLCTVYGNMLSFSDMERICLTIYIYGLWISHHESVFTASNHDFLKNHE